MEEVILQEKELVQVPAETASEELRRTPIYLVTGVEKIFIGIRIWLQIALLAFRYYRSVPEAGRALKKLWQSTKELYGGKANIKLVKNNSQYFYNIYTPGFPSTAYDHFIWNMFSRIHPRKKEAGKLSFIFFAITRKCPLRCEHCFEADNLNGKEAFTLDELKQVVDTFQQDDLAQFHLSGGEPMVRINDLEELIATSDRKS
jgi:sulfatase maturation enzyme AslB (radical SAM superfamily)